MTARRLLLLDASGLTAYHWQSGHLRNEGHFAEDDTGVLAFGEYLHGRRDSLFHLLVDIAEEGFQIEDVPFVQGRDRRSLIERKLGQFFYGTPLATAISLGRQKEGRRDERILFAGLTGYTHIEPWLQAMRQAETQLAGVLSMPLVIASGLAGLVAGGDNTLVITIAHSGLRQTFFEHGQLRFSRLTPMAGGSTEEIAVACGIETDKIYQYLASQRLIARGTPLATLVVAHPDHTAIIRNRCPDTPERQLRFVDLVDQAARNGLHTRPTDSFCETLFLHLLLQKPPRQQLAPAADRRYFRLWQARFALRATALGGFALCLLLATHQASRWWELADRNAELQAQIENDKRRYDGILQALPKVPISTDDLRVLAERYENLARRSPGLEPMLLPLSRGLNQAANVELTRLTWRLANRPDEEHAGKPGEAGRSAPSPPLGAAADGYAILEVNAQLPAGTAVAPRSQLKTISDLAAAIGTGAAVKTQIVTMPMETESGKTIKSSGEAAAPMGPQAFSFRMVSKL